MNNEELLLEYQAYNRDLREENLKLYRACCLALNNLPLIFDRTIQIAEYELVKKHLEEALENK